MSHSVHRLHYATVRLAGDYNPPTFEDTRIPVFGYLIVSPDTAIVVDTGVGYGNAYIDKTFQPERNPIEDQLADWGVAIDDISHVINSHLHFDHCGNNSRFTRAKIVVQQAELSAAKAQNYTVKEWFDYDDAQFQVIDGEAPIAPGIRVIPTPGHTPGHQSVIVDTDHGDVLVACQAAFRGLEYTEGGHPQVQAHEGLHDAYLASISTLKSVEACRVMFSHDTVELKQLPA